ncbi:hypothetical protein Fuma_04204 [Fuerstiella marisgermanici]|uniref:Uncharacterized protein n=1 Tax=Fuerstiella marisgermanici TaxID=1891926 RepID=A0A1P8WKI0_9PLAN|nr:hypothetical protein Fuma_04204 [Fuerstiella marisgermanici]
MRTASRFTARLCCIAGLSAAVAGSAVGEDDDLPWLEPINQPPVSSFVGTPIATQQAVSESRTAFIEERSARRQALIQQLSSSSDMTVNNVLLTNGDDSTTGVVKIADLTPTPDTLSVPPAPALPHASIGTGPITERSSDLQPLRQGRNVQKYRRADGNIVKHNSRRGTTKVKQPGGFLSHFFEFHDPELERFDPDDYEMPILLVAASEEQDEGVVDMNDGERKGPMLRKLTNIQPTLDYAWGDWEKEELPTDFYDRMDNGPYFESEAPRTVLQWAPTNLWYHPLYFQDVGLERYGHTHKPWIQPFVSSGRFFGQAVGLPYQMVLHPPKSREFALGYYQPGEWAPKLRYQIPFNEEAAATEFLWVTGLILLVP